MARDKQIADIDRRIERKMSKSIASVLRLPEAYTVAAQERSDYLNKKIRIPIQDRD